jgi:hypothetical protein
LLVFFFAVVLRFLASFFPPAAAFLAVFVGASFAFWGLTSVIFAD